jgi:hypothetical protein
MLDAVTALLVRFGSGGVHQGKSLIGTAGRERGDVDEVDVGQPTDPGEGLRGENMAAMKPRTGDGPLEVTKEGRGIVMRVPLEGGGRLVVEMTPDEANALGDALKTAAG